MLDFFLWFWLVLSLAAIVGLVVLLRRALTRVVFYETWTEEFIVRLFDSYNVLKKIDVSGHFEADDEVGYFFKTLKDMMARLYQLGVLDEDEIKESQTKQQEILSTEEINRVLSDRRRAKISP